MNSHDRQPVVVTGRRNTPYDDAGRDELRRVAARDGGNCGGSFDDGHLGSSLLPLEQVGDDLVDLIVGEIEVGHTAVLPAVLVLVRFA